MVLTISVLTKNNAHLGLIWKLATTRDSKLIKVSKYSCIHHSVKDTCHTILNLMEGNRTKQEKCSLYIIAQLMYGTTIVFSKQVEFLFRDVEEFVNLIKRHYFNLTELNLITNPEKKLRRRKYLDIDEEYRTPRKRSKKNISDVNLDLEDFPTGYQALPETITMKENILLTTPMQQGFDADDLVPLSDSDFNNLFGTLDGTFFDYQTSSGSQKMKEDIRNASSFFDPPGTAQNFEMLTSPNNPAFNFLPIDEELVRQSQITPQKRVADEILEPSAELRDILTMGVRAIDKWKSIDEELEDIRVASMNEALTPFKAPQSFELDDIEESLMNTPSKTPNKRRRYDGSSLQITFAEIRRIQQDYSFLLHEDVKKIFVMKREKGEMTLKELMDPSPFYHLNKRFNSSLIKLYEQPEKVTFNYEIGTTAFDASGEEIIEKFTNQEELEEIDMENLRFMTTPIKIDRNTAPSTPKTPTNVEIPRESQNNLALMDISLNADVNSLHESRNSQEKRHFYEFDTPRKEYWSSSCVVKCETIEENIYKKAESNMPFPSKFDELFDSNTDVKLAAKSFYVLLEMTKEQIIRVNQDEPYDPIEIQLIQCNDLEDIDELAEMEENLMEKVADLGFVVSESS